MTTPSHKTVWTIAKWVVAVVFGLFGIVLLVAGKIAAGTGFTSAAIIVALPLNRFIKHRQLLWRTRLISITILLVIAVLSIAGTDLTPQQRITGNDAVDKITAIFEEFRNAISGKNHASKGGAPEITQEKANQLTACLRNHGLADLPDPKLTEDGLSFDYSHVNATKAVISQAQKACEPILETAK